jgi:hypothetical protein
MNRCSRLFLLCFVSKRHNLRKSPHLSPVSYFFSLVLFFPFKSTVFFLLLVRFYGLFCSCSFDLSRFPFFVQSRWGLFLALPVFCLILVLLLSCRLASVFPVFVVACFWFCPFSSCFVLVFLLGLFLVLLVFPFAIFRPSPLSSSVLPTRSSC